MVTQKQLGQVLSVLAVVLGAAGDEGLAELANWLEGQIAIDQVDDAVRELNLRGLAV